MKIKIMVDRESYKRLVHDGKAGWAIALNDFVSSTRKDPERVLHKYESRRDLVLAALRAAGGEAVGVRIADDRHFGEPLDAFVTNVGGAIGDGLRFVVDVAGGPAMARPAKGGAR